MNINLRNGDVCINGNIFKGNNVSIVNGKVIIDGVEQKQDKLTGDINITVNGDVEHLENACGTVIANNVGNISTQSGRVECKDVAGSISTMSGRVECDKVGGSIQTMNGRVSHR